MADRPILFSASMVRALLAGTKTQTRRVLKPAPFVDAQGNFCAPDRKGRLWNWGQHIDGRPCIRNYAEKHIRIRTGDRLWVRETWTAQMTHGWTIADARSRMYREKIFYAADGEASIDGWWPSIHMPREFSRLTLNVTEVRVQRLHDISEADAFAEGVEPGFGGGPIIEDYICLWNSIHGPFANAANPWVAAYTFTVEPRNIDAKASS